MLEACAVSSHQYFHSQSSENIVWLLAGLVGPRMSTAAGLTPPCSAENVTHFLYRFALKQGVLEVR